MTFGCRFAPPMFGPVQRASHQANRRRVHYMDEPLETKDKPRTTIATKTRLQLLQMFEHRIEKSLSHLWITCPIGVRKRLFAGRLSPAQSRDRTRMQSQRVANIV